MSARIRKMRALASPAVLSFVARLRGRPVPVLLTVPVGQAPVATDNAKRFCEVLYGTGNVKVTKT